LAGDVERPSAGIEGLMREAIEEPYEEAESHGRVVRGEEEFAEAQFRIAGEQVPKRRSVSVERLASAVAEQFGVEATELGRPGRYRKLSRLRAVVACVGREVAGHPITRTARHFGREGSTLVRTVLRLERELTRDRRLDQQIHRLVRALRSP
jgi:chromosomal replication initiation ATPase DnaA